MNEHLIDSSEVSRMDEFPWAIAEGYSYTHPFQLRFRQFSLSFPRAKFPTRLNVFWAMNSPNTNGLASPEDIDSMHTFEDRLVSATEPHAAVLAMVVTGRGEREFVFFTKSAEVFVQLLSSMPQESSRYPIKIHAAADPDWSYFENEVRATKEA